MSFFQIPSVNAFYLNCGYEKDSKMTKTEVEGWGKRHTFVLMSFLSFATQWSLKSILNVSIVAMVQHPEQRLGKFAHQFFRSAEIPKPDIRLITFNTINGLLRIQLMNEPLLSDI